MSITDLLNNAPTEEPERQYYFIAEAKKIIEKKEQELGRKLTCCVTTFGCQMNARDSEKLLGVLKEIGYVETESENADFVIYNTCTVRENANNKVYGHLGILHGYKKKNKDMMIEDGLGRIKIDAVVNGLVILGSKGTGLFVVVSGQAERSGSVMVLKALGSHFHGTD